MENEGRTNTIIYRLDSIEKSIALVTEKIDGVNKVIADSRVSDNQTKNDIEDLDKRVSLLESRITGIEKNVNEIISAPGKAAAKKWDYITDYIFKSLVAIAVGYILVKGGLK